MRARRPASSATTQIPAASGWREDEDARTVLCVCSLRDPRAPIASGAFEREIAVGHERNAEGPSCSAKRRAQPP
jgi:hypothetical protein